jgi:hypothetical protein
MTGVSKWPRFGPKIDLLFPKTLNYKDKVIIQFMVVSMTIHWIIKNRLLGVEIRYRN